jgi:hypothetical protein
MTYAQCDILIAKQSFQLKVAGQRGRPVSVRIGDRFWVTSATYRNVETVKIDRKGKGNIGDGYLLTVEFINNLFEVEQ